MLPYRRLGAHHLYSGRKRRPAHLEHQAVSLEHLAVPEYHDQWPQHPPIEVLQPSDSRLLEHPSGELYGPSTPAPAIGPFMRPAMWPTTLAPSIDLACTAASEDCSPIEQLAEADTTSIDPWPHNGLIDAAFDWSTIQGTPAPDPSAGPAEEQSLVSPDYDACLMSQALFDQQMQAAMEPPAEPPSPNADLLAYPLLEQEVYDQQMRMLDPFAVDGPMP